MRWEELEGAVAEIVSEKFQQTDHSDLKRYLSNLRRADTELNKLHRGGSVNYGLPAMGDAYLLSYHLGRADLIALALHNLYPKEPIPKKFTLLDAGCGTCAGLAGALYFFSRSSSDISLNYIGTDDSAVMIDGGRRMESKLDALSPPKFTTVLRGDIALEDLTNYDSVNADLVLLSHVIWAPENQNQAKVLRKLLRQAANHVKPGGLILFITPNIESKLKIMDDVVADFLGEQGFKNIFRDGRWTNKRATNAPRKHPRAVLEVRRAINKKCREMGLLPCFDESPARYDPGVWESDPFYYSNARVDAFKALQ